MSKSLPMHFLVVVFAGWLNRQHQAVIEYLKTEKPRAVLVGVQRAEKKGDQAGVLCRD